MLKRISVRTRLILVLSTVLVVAFVSITVAGYLVARNRYRAVTLNESLPLISKNVLAEVQRDLMTPIHVSSLMAHDTFLMDWSLAGERDMPQITRYLREIKERYGFFTAFFVSERTGNYFYYDGILKTVSEQDAHDVWYYAFRNSGMELDLDVDTDEASAGTLTIFINHRLNDYRGEFLGVTGVGLKLDQVGRILSDYQARYQRTVFLTDAAGLVQVHPDASLVETATLLDILGQEAVSAGILSQKKDLAIYEMEEGDRHLFVAARYFPQFDWYLILLQGADVPMGPLRSALFSTLGIGFLVTCVIIGIFILVVNSFQGRLERLATVDELTQVANRRHFMTLLRSESARTARYDRPLSLLMIDADHFKAVNDTHGHAVGDRVLMMLARTVQEALRESDVLGRIGGEEFAVILPETGLDEAVRVAERIRKEVASRGVETEAGLISLTISLGAAQTHAGDANVEDLIHRADLAMYRAKEQGRNRVCADAGTAP